MHAVVGTGGHLLALQVMAAEERDHALVETLAEATQGITGELMELAYFDQDYAGQSAAEAAKKTVMQLEVAKHTEAKRGLVLLPRRSVVERRS